MKREITFTVKDENFIKEIYVSMDILVSDLIKIITQNYSLEGGTTFYSMNHLKILDTSKNLFEEKIWDGDILKIVR